VQTRPTFSPKSLGEHKLNKVSIVGNLLVMSFVVDGCEANCSGMSTKNYNSFPEAPEVIVDLDENIHLIQKRQSLDQIFQNEEYVPTELL
jgi:diaminopimelate decarboxylase